MRVQLTKDFYLDEFECQDKSDINLEVFDNILELADNMQLIRDYLGKPITINSAYRSPSYNKKIGGAKLSQHIIGNACDFTVKGYTPDEVADKLEELIKDLTISQGGIGRYDTFTHYDIRGIKARWDLRTK